MNERQLATAFRDLDVPVTPDPAFADALFTELRAQSRPPQTQRVALLLVAAMLLVLAIGLAIAGSQPENPLQDGVVPGPSAPTYVVSVPDGADPASDPLAVEAALDTAQGRIADLRRGHRVEEMEWIPAGVEFTLPDGSAWSSESPYWAVTLLPDGSAPLATDSPTRLLLFVSDAGLDVIGSDSGDVVPEPTVAPVPTIDPGQLLLVTPDGAPIEPEVIPMPDPGLRPSVDLFAFHGDALWAWVTFPYGGGEPYLLRIDPATLEQTRIPLSDGRLPSVFVPGTGPEPTELPAAGDERPIALDEHGLWVGEVGGITLVDPATGAVIRTIPTLEGEGHSYRRIWEPPAFGSLWDYDRGEGLVRRIDPVTGKTQAEIPIAADVNHENCSDPRPLRGVTGQPDLLAANCWKRIVLVDPATNRFLRAVPNGEHRDVVAAGAWLAGDGPGYDPGDPWQEPGGLVRLDPEGGPTTPVFTLNQDRTGVLSPVVVGDSLWFLAAVRPGLDNPYEEQPRLVRVPLDALGLEAARP